MQRAVLDWVEMAIICEERRWDDIKIHLETS